MTSSQSLQALKGVKVLDLSRFYPGPFCSMMLADFGAEVLCIEDRRFEADLSLPTTARNKRHMTLNLKTQKGREIFFALVKGHRDRNRSRRSDRTHLEDCPTDNQPPDSEFSAWLEPWRIPVNVQKNPRPLPQRRIH